MAYNEEMDNRNLDALYRMASKFLGYSGPKTAKALQDFAKSNPAASAKLSAYTSAMAKGGVVRKMAEGGDTSTQETTTTETTTTPTPAMMSAKDVVEKSIKDPKDLVTTTETPTMVADPNQFIQEGTGQVSGTVAAGTTPVTDVAQADTTPAISPTQIVESTVSDRVESESQKVKAAQGQVSPEAIAQAATQDPTTTAVGSIDAAQGTAYLIDSPAVREIQEGELISGVADAEKASKFNEQIQAAQATPTEKATVQGQLNDLMTQFEDGQTPPWAAGAMRAATAAMAARGLGASSMAGQALIQAAMESAIPIAAADAQTFSQFEQQNLSNRQQRAMLAAEQRAQFMGLEFNQAFQARVANASRISDIADMNFTAEQQVILENARAVNTMNMANLNNRQAMAMAETAAIAQLETQNLNNRQQAAVQKAQAFLEMDMSNLDKRQQADMFASQSRINALFSDQAAENAAAQFNASSQNQVDQFFAELSSQVSRFNAGQKNALAQFNAGEENAAERFNAEVQAAREQFNASNSLIIDQANTKWRQSISATNTAMDLEASLEAARTANALTIGAVNEIFQKERDLMDYAFTAGESAADRSVSLLMADKEAELAKWRQTSAENAAEDQAKGYILYNLGSKLLFGGGSDSGWEGLFG